MVLAVAFSILLDMLSGPFAVLSEREDSRHQTSSSEVEMSESLGEFVTESGGEMLGEDVEKTFANYMFNRLHLD